MNRIISSGDPVHRIVGSLSGKQTSDVYRFSYPNICMYYLFTYLCIRSRLMIGTLGYVMSELEDGKPLSQVVQAAKKLGYTEPGPSSFILVIIAHILFSD